MRYKNKDIRSMYSVSFASYIVGLVLTLLALLLLVCGFVFAGKKYNNQMHLDDAMKLSGNHAVRVVYFDIVILLQIVLNTVWLFWMIRI